MTNLGSLSADVLLAPGPNDSVSELRWSPMSNHLTISAWDNILRVYEITQPSGSSHSGNLLFTHASSAPLLCCDWSKDGTLVATGSTNHKAFLLDLNAHGSLPIQVAAHTAPVKSVRFVNISGSNGPILATGSWDETIKFWDLRQNTPLASLSCEGRVFSMDSAGMLLAAATSEGKVHVVDLNNPTVCRTATKTALHKQIRVVSCFPTGDGYAVGGIEGRCAFVYLNPEKASENFSFKCHRFDTPVSTSASTSTSQRSLLSSQPQTSSTDVYAVNAISFHPLHRTFSTAGSDGSFAFWDQAAHLRLRHFPHLAATSASSGMASTATDRQTTIFGSGGSARKLGNVSTGVAGQAAITATGFNGDGGLFAYAVGYDWSKGYRGSFVGREDRVIVHVVGDECAPKSAGRAGKTQK